VSLRVASMRMLLRVAATSEKSKGLGNRGFITRHFIASRVVKPGGFSSCGRSQPRSACTVKSEGQTGAIARSSLTQAVLP
jgi:hypothetical protein